MRIGMVHQPHFLPWPSYLARCVAIDELVILDNVKFNRNHFQQRTKFISKEGSLKWLSLPIDRATRSKNISEVLISTEFNLQKWERSVIESYRTAPYFDPIWNEITDIIQSSLPSFCNISVGLLEYTLGLLSEQKTNINTKLYTCSAICDTMDRSQRLLDICKFRHFSHLVMGKYSLESHDIKLLQESGIILLEHNYTGPKQHKPVPGLMGMHQIMHKGAEETSDFLTSCWELVPINGARNCAN